MGAMTLEKFNTLSRRDFDNGAVLDEIAEALKLRAKVQEYTEECGCELNGMSPEESVVRGLESMSRAFYAADEERTNLRAALRELFVTVKGECPSLLNEDSGGNGELYVRIEALLKTLAKAEGANGS
jgi:hypothetical protein